MNTSESNFPQIPIPTPEIVDFSFRMYALFSYELPPNFDAPFLKFHDWLTNPQPRFITEWRDADSPWYLRFVDGVLSHPRHSFRAMLYHADNLLTLEQRATEMARSACPPLAPNSVMAVSTEKLDFEYQALELAHNRFFEHLTRGLNAFFKDRNHELKSFGRLMRRKKAHPVAIALAEAYEALEPRLTPMFSRSDETSLRSRIMHHEAVPAGTLNITFRGEVRLLGGGDNLQRDGKKLSDVISERTSLMHDYATAIMDAFVPAAGALDAARK